MDKLKVMNSDTFRYKPLDGFIEEYFQKTHVSYSYNLAGNAISATLYKVDLERSTASEDSGAVLEKIGPESPYRFIRIESVPLYNCTQVELAIDWSEDKGYGSSTNKLECVVHPSNLAIDVDDYIVLQYSSFKNLYRIIAASPDTFEQLAYMRLTLEATQYTQENIEFQVTKRFSYIFQTSSILDQSANDIITDLLGTFNNNYKNFLSIYYAPHRIIIKPERLEKLETYFEFHQLDSSTKLYSYYFKKYLSNGMISERLDTRDNVERFFKNPYTDDPVVMFQDDEAKFMYYYIRNMEKGDDAYTALKKTMQEFEEIRTKKVREELKFALNNYNHPFYNFFDDKVEFFKPFMECVQIATSSNILVDSNEKGTLKFLNNLKKISKLLSKASDKDLFLYSLLTFLLIKCIPFRNITFTKRQIEYGN